MVVGWSWVVLGLLNFAFALFSGWTLRGIGDPWIYAWVILGLIVGVLTLVAAVSFLHRRQWARYALEFVCWLALIVGLYKLHAEYEVYLEVVKLHVPEYVRPFRQSRWATSMAMAFFVAWIIFLRSKGVRAVFSNTNVKSGET